MYFLIEDGQGEIDECITFVFSHRVLKACCDEMCLEDIGIHVERDMCVLFIRTCKIV